MLAHKEGNCSRSDSDTSRNSFDNYNSHSAVPIPNPIIRQDTFDIDERNVEEAVTPPRNQIGMSTASQVSTEIVEQISKLFSTSNISVLQQNNLEASLPQPSQIQPTYIVVVPGASPQIAGNFNQNQNQNRSMRTRRSFSFNLEKKPTLPIRKETSETPNKPRSTLLTRRSSFSSPQVAAQSSARKTLAAVENSSARNNGKRLSFAPPSLKVTGNLAEKNGSLRPKHGAIKKTSPRRPGPLKAVPMPQIQNQPIKSTGNLNTRLPSAPGNFVSRLMPKSPSLIYKNNKRLSFVSNTPQPSKSTTSLQSASSSRKRSLSSVGQKTLLGDY
jgi:hypothetical protein